MLSYEGLISEVVESGFEADVPKGPCIYITASTPTLNIGHVCTFFQSDPADLVRLVDDPNASTRELVCAGLDCPFPAREVVVSRDVPRQEWGDDNLLDLIELRMEYQKMFCREDTTSPMAGIVGLYDREKGEDLGSPEKQSALL